MAFRKQTWTKYSAYKILWLVSLQIHQNLNTLHQYSKKYIQSNNASITNCVFLHIKHFKFSNLLIFTIVFLFLLTLCLQDHLIHRFCSSHMSEHLWVKGPFLSVLQDSGTPSRQTPVTRYLFLRSAQNSKPIFSSSLPTLNFFNTIFVSSHMYPENPSNRRLNEHGIYIRHCQESNSQPVPSQAGVDTTRPQWRNSLLSYHRTAYPDLILVFPLLLALLNYTWC